MTMKLIVLGIFAVCMLCSCDKSSKYDKAIADFVQTDKKGVWTDLKFKVIEMGTPIDITIADSVKILTEKFEKQKSDRIATLTESIDKNRASRDKERFNSMKQFYQSLIDKNQVIVDSLSAMNVSLPDTYLSGKPEQVLAKEVTCKFSITPPTYNTHQEITETFIVSADGTKCYRRASKPKK